MSLNNKIKVKGIVLHTMLAGVVVGIPWTGRLFGQDAMRTLEPLMVVGSLEAVAELPGSAAFVEAEQFRERGLTNIAQVAAAVPSVFIRDEDGFGNFPNISIRGVDGNRSSKVTIMEDGILTAPSPYSAPAAYYMPRVARMSAVEFLKGSSQVRYGPQTTGGVVNFLSTPIPQEGGPVFFSRNTYGSENTFFSHTWYGDTVTTSAGTFGYLFELHGMTTDGNRTIDGSGKDTGFDVIEPMLKLAWQPATPLDQRLEFKFGFTDFDANETYAGTTVTDLRANPDRRYAATLYDRHESEHLRTYMKWVGIPSDNLRLETALYYNSFRRNWDKLDGLSGPGLRTNIGEALMHDPSVAVLKGLGTGGIFTRDAFRKHESYGLQSQANFEFETGPASHDLAVGLRLHYDRAGGTNQQIFYASNEVGGFGPANPNPATSAGLNEVFATAIFIEDAIRIGALGIRPGVRYELLDVGSTTGAGVHRSADEHLIMGGVGLTYDFDECNSLFGGVYRGASPPNPAGYIAGTDSEESLGFELGYRHQRDHLRAEIVGFYTDFDNLIAPEVGTGLGGLSPSRNAGSAVSQGLEFVIEYDVGGAENWTYGLPVYFSATYTDAEFSGMGGRLGNAAGLFAGGRNGNEIPYVPEWKLAAGISLQAERWAVNFDTSFLSSTWGTGYNDEPRLNDDGTLANPSAIDGKVDSLFLADLSGHYQVNDHLRLVAGIQNLFDSRKLVTRAPLGPRTNAPRSLFAGFEARF